MSVDIFQGTGKEYCLNYTTALKSKSLNYADKSSLSGHHLREAPFAGSMQGTQILAFWIFKAEICRNQNAVLENGLLSHLNALGILVPWQIRLRGKRTSPGGVGEASGPRQCGCLGCLRKDWSVWECDHPHCPSILLANVVTGEQERRSKSKCRVWGTFVPSCYQATELSSHQLDYDLDHRITSGCIKWDEWKTSC